MRDIALIIAGVIFYTFAVAAITGPPVCPEDAVAVGRGAYEPVIGWTRYECIALDDITEVE